MTPKSNAPEHTKDCQCESCMCAKADRKPNAQEGTPGSRLREYDGKPEGYISEPPERTNDERVSGRLLSILIGHYADFRNSDSNLATSELLKELESRREKEKQEQKALQQFADGLKGMDINELD